MMARILLTISLAAVTLAAKDRAWQPGTLLDKTLNPYIRTANDSGSKSGDATPMVGDMAVSVNVHRSTGDLVYDEYIIEGADMVYAVEVTRFKNTKAAHLSLSLPLNFAVEKSRLYIKDLDRQEFEGQILRQVEKTGTKKGETVASAEPKPAPVAATQKAPAKADVPKADPGKAVAANIVPVKAQAKPDAVVASVQAPASKTAVSQPAPKPPVQTPPAAPKPAPKLEASVSTPAAQPRPQMKPETATAARGTSKDRAWQSGQLLMVVNNGYFLNVTYSSDIDGSNWPFVQGSDGRYTVNGQIGNPTSSLYTYDNYVIESQFCAYLVQRMRPKTSATARLPGNKPLKFAVEKNKLWVVDEENIEYETKVIKLVQKDSIVNPVTRAAAQ
ncbi:MAG TPA: hypothetical protein VGG72_06150 [Bryobacteraceae bacterium]|jgi:hypothetical protein